MGSFSNTMASNHRTSNKDFHPKWPLVSVGELGLAQKIREVNPISLMAASAYLNAAPTYVIDVGCMYL